MIFCVEDDRNIRELLVYTLSTTGYQAQGFGSGKELFQELKNQPAGADSSGYHASRGGWLCDSGQAQSQQLHERDSGHHGDGQGCGV